jgi:dolichyl-phosphate beta-glucosyltransferase
MTLSVIIPAYNEAKRLPATLARAGAWLDAHHPEDFEILVVDDGSRDGTAAVVREWMTDNPRVRLCTQAINRGKGAAVRRGMLEARGDVRLFMDADHSTHIRNVQKVFAAMRGGADIVIASRQHPDSEITVSQSWARKSMGKTFNLLVRAFVSLPFSDTQCGFKAFTGASAAAVFARQKVAGFSSDVEALYLGKRLGFRVAEIPVEWLNDDSSTVRLPRDAFRMFADLVRIRRLHQDLNAAASYHSHHGRIDGPPGCLVSLD